VPAYYLACAPEHLGPRDLLVQAVEGEKAYFDGICCPGESGEVWARLAAAGRATEYVRLGATVAAPLREESELVARGLAELESRFPGRAFLGVDPGDSARDGSLEEALARAGGGRRPPVYLRGHDESTAHLAGALADGLWTLADPERAPMLVEAYHEGCAEAGRDAGEILLEASFSLAQAREHALVRAATGPAGSEGSQPAPGGECLPLIASPDPDEHVERIREIERLGATAIVLVNVWGPAPVEAVRVYGRDVLPKLRG
jgi:coenzyme F420-dependent glucose-6-phosphate dehydrogenase